MCDSERAAGRGAQLTGAAAAADSCAPGVLAAAAAHARPTCRQSGAGASGFAAVLARTLVAAASTATAAAAAWSAQPLPGLLRLRFRFLASPSSAPISGRWEERFPRCGGACCWSVETRRCAKTDSLARMWWKWGPRPGQGRRQFVTLVAAHPQLAKSTNTTRTTRSNTFTATARTTQHQPRRGHSNAATTTASCAHRRAQSMHACVHARSCSIRKPVMYTQVTKNRSLRMQLGQSSEGDAARRRQARTNKCEVHHQGSCACTHASTKRGGDHRRSKQANGANKGRAQPGSGVQSDHAAAVVHVNSSARALAARFQLAGQHAPSNQSINQSASQSASLGSRAAAQLAKMRYVLHALMME